MKRVPLTAAVVALAVALGVAALTWSAAQETPAERRYFGSGQTPGELITASDEEGEALGSATVAADGSWSISLSSDAALVYFQINGVAAGSATAAAGQTRIEVRLLGANAGLPATGSGGLADGGR